MMSRSSNGNSIGVLGLLGVAFIVLKLTGFIDWSWWWVTVPFWGGLAIVVISLFVVFIVLLVIELIKSYKQKQQEKT